MKNIMFRKLVITVVGVVAVPFSFAQEIIVGEPLSATNESGVHQVMSDNVKVFGSFHFTESCTFDPERNLILSMNAGNRGEGDAADDGFVSLINPDGSVHTAKWIGASREGLQLRDPIGSAVRNGMLYTVDSGFLRSFDLSTGQPVQSIEVPGSSFLNGIAVDDNGTAYISNSRAPEQIFKVTSGGDVTVFAEGGEINIPNGVAMDNDGNIVVINIGNNAVISYNPEGDVVLTEYAAEAGNDGVVVTEDGTKYVSSVRFGSVSRIRPGQEAEIIAHGIPSAASMCYDSVQKQLVIPMNPNNALAFIPL